MLQTYSAIKAAFSANSCKVLPHAIELAPHGALKPTHMTDEDCAPTAPSIIVVNNPKVKNFFFIVF
jgi:hypothetical protein